MSRQPKRTPFLTSIPGYSHSVVNEPLLFAIYSHLVSDAAKHREYILCRTWCFIYTFWLLMGSDHVTISLIKKMIVYAK